MHVAFDGVRCKMEVVRDLLVAHPGRDQIDHLPLSLRQPHRRKHLALALSRGQLGYL